MNNKNIIKSKVNDLIPSLIESIKEVVSYRSVLDETASD